MNSEEGAIVASTAVRRPLPAIVLLLALLLLTAIVWWRVLHRDNGTTHKAAKACPSVSTTVTTVLPAQRTVEVQVLNSTNRSGIATAARSALVANGFRSPRKAGNFTSKRTITVSGEIRYSLAEKSAATLVSYYLPGSQLVPTRTTRSRVVIVLGAKYTRIATAATLRRELAAAHSRIQGQPIAAATTTC